MNCWKMERCLLLPVMLVLLVTLSGCGQVGSKSTVELPPPVPQAEEQPPPPPLPPEPAQVQPPAEPSPPEPSVMEAPPPENPPKPEYVPQTGAATALFRKAQSAMQAGQYKTAEMHLERALRIEPRNPHYWYAMAQVKFKQAEYSQTVQFCLKAKSLAASLPQLIERSRELMKQARQAMQ